MPCFDLFRRLWRFWACPKVATVSCCFGNYRRKIPLKRETLNALVKKISEFMDFTVGGI